MSKRIVFLFVSGLVLCNACSSTSMGNKRPVAPAEIRIKELSYSQRAIIKIKNLRIVDESLLDKLNRIKVTKWELSLHNCKAPLSEIKKLAVYKHKITFLKIHHYNDFDPAMIEYISHSEITRKLFIRFTRLKDEDMRLLDYFKNLRQLAIVNTRITDNSIKYILRFPDLIWLSLGKNHLLTGKALEKLTALKKIRTLRIWETGIRGKDMYLLRRFTDLRTLSVAKLIRGTGIKEIGKLKQLRFLDMGNSDIKDDDLQHLTGLRRLRLLNLSFSTIGDGVVTYLGRLKRLRMLFLGYTKITDVGKSRLRSLLPGCRIH